MRRLFLVLAVLIAACSGSPGAPSGASPVPRGLTVVTTSTVFADMVRNVGGDRVTVTSLVPAGTDVHTYQARPDDLRAVDAADVVLMNGLALDDWLESTIEAVAAGTPIVRLAVDLPGVELLPGDEPGTQNPHLWLDVSLARQYVTRIAEALAAADTAGAAAFAAGAAAYDIRLADLDDWVRAQLATIPPVDRQVVTFHDALPYFARAYGLVIVGVAVEAPGQDPSAGEIAGLVDAIRESGVQAIFSEDQFPTALVDQIGRETGASVVADLFTDSLGADPVTSYEALIRWDVDRIVEALR
ncbi:MAG TPA: metal ABC transporter substrate-binding protein [Candidatus Sulfomarinibacteraceae bacterium]|nr:metal ABC transporter substrate-binding protein [Candidatus Sulfomarinibacteraceae bacterium]